MLALIITIVSDIITLVSTGAALYSIFSGSQLDVSQLVANLEVSRSVRADIQHYLTVANKFQRYACTAVYPDGDIRRQPIVSTPFPDGTDQVGRRWQRILHLRITFSEGVSASINAGRLKIRSAYFINGAACFGNWIP